MQPTVTRLIGHLTAIGIRMWVRSTGQRVRRKDALWLSCPSGSKGRIGAEFYAALCTKEKLHIEPSPDAGLLPDFGALRGPSFNPDKVDAQVRDFYEHTARYHLEAWSEAPWPTRFFLWGLTYFVSQQMDQLNFPVSSLELAGGMSSEILPLLDKSGRRIYTGWLRRLGKSGRVIYTGLYSTAQPPNYKGSCVKVSFPLPHGSATVFLRPEAQKDGSLKLISSGSQLGDPGFYRMVDAGSRDWKVRYIRTLRESFHVYVDPKGDLRTEHLVRFMGFTVLRLHYKMQRQVEQGKGGKN